MTKLIARADVRPGRRGRLHLRPRGDDAIRRRALLERGVPAERIYVSMERNMKCAVGPVRALPVRARVRLPRRPGVCGSSDIGQASGSGRSDGREPGTSPSWRSGSSPPATAASSACSTARTSCSRLAGEIEIAYFLEARRATVEGPYDLSLVEGSITTAEDAERIHEVRRRSRTPGDDRRLRDRRAGSRRCATSPTSRSSSSVGLRLSGVHLHARDLDPDQRPRPGRLRAAGLPDQQAPAARGDQRLPQRAPPGDRPSTASASSASAAATSA